MGHQQSKLVSSPAPPDSSLKMTLTTTTSTSASSAPTSPTSPTSPTTTTLTSRSASTSTATTSLTNSPTTTTSSSSPHSPAHSPAHSPFLTITRPAPPGLLTRLSEIIDPNDLLSSYPSSPDSSDATSPRQPATPTSPKSTPKYTFIQSPSGNLLDSQAYFEHPDRPLTVRERQERIAAVVRGKVEVGKDRDGESNGMAAASQVERKRRKKGWSCGWGCFGGEGKEGEE